jgi:hypothetical protein
MCNVKLSPSRTLWTKILFHAESLLVATTTIQMNLSNGAMAAVDACTVEIVPQQKAGLVEGERRVELDL